MASKDLAKPIPRYEQLELLRECSEAALTYHPTIKTTLDLDPTSELLKTLVAIFSLSDPRHASIATSVWGETYESKEQQSEELSVTVQDPDYIFGQVTPDLVSILAQTDANAFRCRSYRSLRCHHSLSER